MQRVELRHQRWKVSAKAPTAAPDEFSLKTMVPALEMPVDKLGDMLKGLGAENVMAGSVLQCFEALRGLATQQEAKEKAEKDRAARLFEKQEKLRRREEEELERRL